MKRKYKCTSCGSDNLAVKGCDRIEDLMRECLECNNTQSICDGAEKIKIIEIKIMFKNGEEKYYKLYDKGSLGVEEISKIIKTSMKEGLSGYITLVDLIDDKKTIIQAEDISTFGYSEVYK